MRVIENALVCGILWLQVPCSPGAVGIGAAALFADRTGMQRGYLSSTHHAMTSGILPTPDPVGSRGAKQPLGKKAAAFLSHRRTWLPSEALK